MSQLKVFGLSERFEMDITSIKPSAYALPQPPSVSAAEASQRRELIQATKVINASGVLGQNELVFVLDRAIHRAVIQVVDRETHEVVLQLPPDYVLRMAEDLRSGQQK